MKIEDHKQYLTEGKLIFPLKFEIRGCLIDSSTNIWLGWMKRLSKANDTATGNWMTVVNLESYTVMWESGYRYREKI